MEWFPFALCSFCIFCVFAFYFFSRLSFILSSFRTHTNSSSISFSFSIQYCVILIEFRIEWKSNRVPVFFHSLSIHSSLMTDCRFEENVGIEIEIGSLLWIDLFIMWYLDGQFHAYKMRTPTIRHSNENCSHWVTSFTCTLSFPFLSFFLIAYNNNSIHLLCARELRHKSRMRRTACCDLRLLCVPNEHTHTRFHAIHLIDGSKTLIVPLMVLADGWNAINSIMSYCS